jgi:ubiquitin carboxyl-terminal hydrolase 10
MFIREYPIIDSATSVEQLRLRLKDGELEQYGEPFTPDFVYDVIKRLPRFVTMQVSSVSSPPIQIAKGCIAGPPARCGGVPWFPTRRAP